MTALVLAFIFGYVIGRGVQRAETLPKYELDTRRIRWHDQRAHLPK
ncbi:hypothetical protein LCGC14_0320190 [marine sediment metagenome]|uniref:Uncharacterized protein n=1 Tax=marine sediment metagenome TaxID=412755 RepID=A0A0F9W6W4_9ZZZZ